MDICDFSSWITKTPSRKASSLLLNISHTYPSTVCSLKVNSCWVAFNAYPVGAETSFNRNVYGTNFPSLLILPVSAMFMDASPFVSVTSVPITVPVSLLLISKTAFSRTFPFSSVFLTFAATGAGLLTRLTPASSASVVWPVIWNSLTAADNI